MITRITDVQTGEAAVEGGGMATSVWHFNSQAAERYSANREEQNSFTEEVIVLCRLALADAHAHTREDLAAEILKSFDNEIERLHPGIQDLIASRRAVYDDCFKESEPNRSAARVFAGIVGHPELVEWGADQYMDAVNTVEWLKRAPGETG